MIHPVSLAAILMVAMAFSCIGLHAKTLVASEAPVRQVAMSAEKAFEEGMGAVNVKRGAAGKGLTLYDHLLIEDDAPGISSTAEWMKMNRSQVENLSGDVRIKKVLPIERLGGLEARLYVPSGVAVEVNGQSLQTPSNTEYPVVPMEMLKEGYNEVVLSGRNKGQSVKLATREMILNNDPSRTGQPPRSFRSDDGGATWQVVDGEFMVRLHLRQYASEGSVLSAVIDMASGEADAGPLAGQVVIGKISARTEAETPEKTSVDLLVRSGKSPVVEEGQWSDWQAADGATVAAGHRYVQWQAVLKSQDAARTPVLKSVTLKAATSVEQLPDWAARGLAVSDFSNPTIRYTSVPFEYEDPSHPKMVALREKYKLDEIVAGAGSELEKMVKLRNWVAQQWKYKPPAEMYPAWDADEILTAKIGFCVQYAIVFTQCATSLGYQSRFVFGNHYGTGHEVSEYWSNELQKWVMFDVNGNMHHLDTKTNTPMSMLELHDLVVRECYGDKAAIVSNKAKGVVTSDAVATCYDLQMTPDKPKKATPDGRFAVPMQWLYVRWMPRNNFYAKPNPIPMTQGTHWDWSDFIVWDNPQMPLQYRYRHFTSRRSDIEWTINQVRYDLACSREADTLTVQMGTVTPYFETFLVRRGTGEWVKSGRSFDWKLEPGRNRLEMRVRNSSGVLGPVSHVEVSLGAQ